MSTPWGCAVEVLRFSQPLGKQISRLVRIGFREVDGEVCGVETVLVTV